MKSIISNLDNAKLLETLSPKFISEKWCESFNIDIGDQFRSISLISYWQCNETGLRWYQPPEAAGSRWLYSQLENFDWYYMPNKYEFEVACKLLIKENRVLEVGVGFGYFLEMCRAKGINIQGMELSPSAAKRAREKGFEVFEESLDDLADRIGECNFDVTCSFQVLEHVSQPREFLEGMLRNLKVGGRLIISVPNAAVMCRIDPEREDLLNQPPHHMSHWDEDVFRALEKILPVKLKAAYREPLASYHVSGMAIGFMRGLMPNLGKTLPRVLINRYTTLPLQWLLNMGLRKLIPGHTLVVEMEKVN